MNLKKKIQDCVDRITILLTNKRSLCKERLKISQWVIRIEYDNDCVTREKDFLTFTVVRFKVSRMSSSSNEFLLNDERNLARIARTRHLKRGNCGMNFTAIQRDGEKQTRTVSRSQRDKIHCREVNINQREYAGIVCMQIRVQQKVRVITPTPRGAELKVFVESLMQEPHSDQMEGKWNLNT